MGARVYIPGIGRFLQVDPQEGGTPNAYVYPPDPVNDFDLTGEFGLKTFANIASVGSMIPGPIGMASAAVSAAAYAKAGDRKQAAIMVASIAAAAVGAGVAVKAAQIASKAAPAAKAVSASSKIAKAISTTGPKNFSEKLTVHVVKANPRIGHEIMKDKIKDPTFKRILGWSKMQYKHEPLTTKGKTVTVHYFYNKYTRSVRQLKVK